MQSVDTLVWNCAAEMMWVANIALVKVSWTSGRREDLKEIRSGVHDMKEGLASRARSLDWDVLDTPWAENCAVGRVCFGIS